MNKLKIEEKQSLEGSLKYVIPYPYIKKETFKVRECHVLWDLD
jgi:hypothetical protein